ncbi:hypothetical protein VTN77DRAFT_773 [Rasamsonia byssochlamydoides]|uniref:uncharacterized protein n=1 Tax=Rasamsonia byssochlamydoides TaxID=89139 RepID=UPI00374210D9
MSRFGGKNGKKPPGAEFAWTAEPGGEPDNAPTPLFPKYDVPKAARLQPREQAEVDRYRALREKFHDGPYYTVLDAARTSAKKGSAARALFDAFHGMPSYSQKYQKKKRALPKIQGRPYALNFFPRELWRTIQPNYKPDSSVFGIEAMRKRSFKRGFEDDEEEEDEEEIAKRRKLDDGEDEDEDEGKRTDEEGDLEEEDEKEEELEDDDFSEDDDEMGGDYNAEQYFDAGEDEGDIDGFADGGGGGDEDIY